MKFEEWFCCNNIMSISHVFKCEDLRQQIFKYKRISCLLTNQAIRQRINQKRINTIIEFACQDPEYMKWLAESNLTWEDDYDEMWYDEIEYITKM